MFRTQINRQLIGAGLIFGLSVLPAWATDNVFVKGKITDQEGQPIAKAKVNFVNKDTQEVTIVRSNRRGEFEVGHAPCNMFNLIVIPTDKHKLTQACLENIGGEQTKHFIVKLKPGFELSGRLLSDGEGLKAINVHVIPVHKNKHNEHHEHHAVDLINGSAYALTDNDGVFKMIITPGDKMVEFTNNRYPNLSHTLSQHVSVTTDAKIPDIILPPKSGH